MPLYAYSFCNGTTLQQAKNNYAEYGACSSHGLWCKTGKYPPHNCADTEPMSYEMGGVAGGLPKTSAASATNLTRGGESTKGAYDQDKRRACVVE